MNVEILLLYGILTSIDKNFNFFQFRVDKNDKSKYNLRELTKMATTKSCRKEGDNMVNTQMLDDAINESGLKISFIVDKLGISRQAFDKKRKGLTPFRASEVYVICDLCNIGDAAKPKIFLP